MDPASALTIAKTAGDISKKLYDLAKNLKDRDVKHTIDEILDQVRDLKQSASELEDENRQLRESLRFKGDDYEFRNPFWFEKKHPDRPLCAKCFANGVAAPMGNRGQGDARNYRRCLVCLQYVEAG